VDVVEEPGPGILTVTEIESVRANVSDSVIRGEQAKRVDQSSASPLPLPLSVLDAEGGLIAEGVTSSSEPAVFNVPETNDPIFVRLTWPSGKTETKKVSSATVTFDDQQISRNEWSAWAVPRLNRKTVLARPDSESPPVSINRFKRVWLRLWHFKSGSWSDTPIVPADKWRNPLAVQFDIDLDERAWCLQLGGPKLRCAWCRCPAADAARFWSL
jgi:hypothetical protein